MTIRGLSILINVLFISYSHHLTIWQISEKYNLSISSGKCTTTIGIILEKTVTTNYSDHFEINITFFFSSETFLFLFLFLFFLLLFFIFLFLFSFSRISFFFFSPFSTPFVYRIVTFKGYKYFSQSTCSWFYYDPVTCKFYVYVLIERIFLLMMNS